MTQPVANAETLAAPPLAGRALRFGRSAEAAAIPLGAIVVSLVIFGAFVAAAGADPFEAYALMYRGAFGTWFSWQNTLQRAAPLLLTALCTALPASLGLVVIGGEGALVVGGVAAAALAPVVAGWLPLAGQLAMALAGMAMGALWIGAAGAMRHWRGVNETIASLVMNYIAIALMNHFVEGVLRDPTSLNKPSTAPLDTALMIGNIPGFRVHWGLAFGIAACVAAGILMGRTAFGFAARVTGGNARAARMVGLGVGRLILTATALGGAAAGLAGFFEVAAVQGSANASLNAGYGYTGILVAFLARHKPLAIVPVAILLGGIGASGGLLQRRLGLPDASVLVLQGLVFVTVLAAETMSGRLQFSLTLGNRKAPA